MEGFELKFKVYAETREEADKAQQVLQDFVNDHGKEGRAVTANKIIEIVPKWKDNFLVKKQIIKYFE